MFEEYPKTRIELPDSFKKIYKEHYINNREGKTVASGLSQKMESWLHKMVAKDVDPIHNKKTLEIGAGTLNQLNYEIPQCYDIIEPFTELFSSSSRIQKVRNAYLDIDEIELIQRYDRIISVATFEHIVDLPKVVAKTCLLLDKNGTLRTSIPNEGYTLWKLGWMLTTGIEFKLKYKLNYGLLMKHEHVNCASDIEEILNYFYRDNQCVTLGIGKRLAFYRFYASSSPNIERAKSYLGINS